MAFEADYLTCNSFSEELLVSYLCGEDETALDVGAGSGRLTRFLSTCSLHVHAFECNPKHIAAIDRGMEGAWEKWGKSSNFENITLHKLAVSGKDGTTSLRAPKNSYGWGTIEQSNKLTRKIDEGIDEFDVTTCRLDTVMRTFKNVGFIKVDVEGHEPEVLSGAERLIDETSPSFYVEIYDGHAPEVSSKVRDFFRTAEYDGFFVRNGRLLTIDECDFKKHLTQPPSQCDINFVFTRKEEHKKRLLGFVDFSTKHIGKIITVQPNGVLDVL